MSRKKDKKPIIRAEKFISDEVTFLQEKYGINPLAARRIMNGFVLKLVCFVADEQDEHEKPLEECLYHLVDAVEESTRKN